jgi:hypothetical protein
MLLEKLLYVSTDVCDTLSNVCCRIGGQEVWPSTRHSATGRGQASNPSTFYDKLQVVAS